MRTSIDICIKGGMIYDGGISEPYVADIAISGDRIKSIGAIDIKDAGMVLDVSGLAVAPGFIDTHAHSDFTMMADPRAEGKVCQGVTTEINGNCGMSAAPLYGKAVERREDDLIELGIKERWNSFEEYFGILEKKGIALNFATLAGHGNIRGSALGYDDKQPSQSELDYMSALLCQAVEEGAIGLSTGLIYPPGVYSGTDELVRLAGMLREPGLIYTSHMRSEGGMLLEAVEEVLRIAREAEIKVHISHIKTAGEQNWRKADDVISLLDEAIGAGTRVTCDRYPYIASCTDLDAIFPAWVFAGGNEEELRRLRDKVEKKRILEEIKDKCSSADYWKKIIISSVVSEENRWMEGKTIDEISRRAGMNEIDSVFRILIEEKLRVGAIFLSMNEENLRKFLSLPFCMIGSDSSARCFEGVTRKGKPHPRTFGTFPRLFGKYVREEKLLSLPYAVHKATMLAAQTFGLRDRGQIREGMYADMVVFDPAKIEDAATFDMPFRKPKGIHYVIINGVPALWEGAVTGRPAGRVLRRK